MSKPIFLGGQKGSETTRDSHNRTINYDQHGQIVYHNKRPQYG